jgi:hypothetical protein
MSSRTRKPTKKALAAAAEAAVAAAAAAAVEVPAAPEPVLEPAVPVPAPVLEVVDEDTIAEPVPPLPPAPVAAAKKPRNTTKKTPPVVAIVTPSGITGTFMTEQRPLIAHLPITSAEISFESSNFLKSSAEDATAVCGFDKTATTMSYLEGIPDGSAVANTILPTPKDTATALEQKCKLPSHYSEKLMVLFQDANRYKKLPEKTEIACFWCCHSFSTQPVAIPSHILDEVWNMYGNFCSPECATASLFKERIDSHVQWERYALLNSLYAEDAEVIAGTPRGIRPAPPREVLRMFGGSMDISEFRALVHEKRLRMDVLTPPMVSIIQTMDTKPIDFYDQNLKNVFIRNDIQHKYNAPGAQGLRLRRTKPVKNRESTVEWAMQITEVGATA